MLTIDYRGIDRSLDVLSTERDREAQELLERLGDLSWIALDDALCALRDDERSLRATCEMPVVATPERGGYCDAQLEHARQQRERERDDWSDEQTLVEVRP